MEISKKRLGNYIAMEKECVSKTNRLKKHCTRNSNIFTKACICSEYFEYLKTVPHPGRILRPKKGFKVQHRHICRGNIKNLKNYNAIMCETTLQASSDSVYSTLF